jgi:glyoxylate reductase
MLERKKVYVTRNLPGPGLSMLSKECDVSLHHGHRPPARKQMLKAIAGKNGIVCMLSDRIDKEAMDVAGPKLEVISSYSTGFEHIDVAEATRRGIYVTFTSDILAETTADLTFALMLACARNIVQGDEFVRQGKWKYGWAPDLMLGYDVYRTTLGIIGMGRIGSAVARRAKGFDMKVIYYSRKRRMDLEAEIGIKYVEMDELLEQSDFISLHTSLNPKSFHMIDRSKFRKMKKTAFVINTARGQLINQEDLAIALKSGQIAGAGLDVFEVEPLPGPDPLTKMKNVVLLPHIGSATYNTRSRMSVIAAQNLLNVLNGIAPPYLVNPEVMNIRPLQSQTGN